GPSPAALKPLETSGDIGAARASHCVRLHIAGGGDAAAQLRRVTADEISTGRVESAAVYCEAELDASAMALGGLGQPAPVSVERRGTYGRSGTDGCGSGRQSDGADTIADADHGSPPDRSTESNAIFFPTTSCVDSVERFSFDIESWLSKL